MATVFEYKEVVGVSTDSIEAAIKQGLDAVSAEYTIGWFEVISLRGRMVDAGTIEHQVTVKVGCKSK